MNHRAIFHPLRSLRHYTRSLGRSIALVLCALGAANIAMADAIDDQVAALQTRWAEVNYQLQGDAQVKAYEELSATAEAAAKAQPKAAPLWIWSGIIKSSLAGAKGGLGALSLAKASKHDLEKAIEIDQTALQGSALTSLGTLYFKVPGWPVGFGDHDKARELLKKALTLNADGIDPNYFYGLFLLEQKEYPQALAALEKAKAAPPRPSRVLADQGRHAEIDAAIAQVKKKMD